MNGVCKLCTGRWYVLKMKYILFFIIGAILLAPNIAASNENRGVDQLPKITQKLVVGNHENIVSLFRRNRLSQSVLYQLITTTGHGPLLNHVHTGDEVVVTRTLNNELVKLVLTTNDGLRIKYQRLSGGYVSSEELDLSSADPGLLFKQGKITKSLFYDGSKVGLSNSQLTKMTTIFNSKIDFNTDTKRGDSFAILFEEENSSNIIAARYVNDGNEYIAYRYVFSNGYVGYFDEQGRNIQGPFLKSPVNYDYISSEFSLNRLHPILNKEKRHNGVDLVAKEGSPVFSVNDGVVIESDYNSANGNYIFISHGSNIITKYLHLKNRYFRANEAVNKRDVIGTVGSTGYATGPHLHYEFLVNNTHLDPMRLQYARDYSDTLDGLEKTRFKNSIEFHKIFFEARIKQNESTRISANF